MLSGTQQFGLVIALFVALQCPAFAQIYKWTDADGNVHYGDKPMNTEAAADAETVNIEEDYTPPERSAQEMEAIQDQERSRSEADRRRREAQEGKLAEDKAARNEQKLARCSALDADIDKFGTAKMINGILNVTYLKGDDGKSISAAEQREIVDDLKRKRSELGCPGA